MGERRRTREPWQLWYVNTIYILRCGCWARCGLREMRRRPCRIQGIMNSKMIGSATVYKVRYKDRTQPDAWVGHECVKREHVIRYELKKQQVTAGPSKTVPLEADVSAKLPPMTLSDVL